MFRMRIGQFILKIIFCSLLLQAAFFSVARAQNSLPAPKEYTLIFKGDKLAYALHKLVESTSINMIYDPAIMSDHTVYATARKKTSEYILRLLLKGSGLDFFQLSSGTYVLTKAPQPTYLHGNLSGQVIDQQTGEPLPGANIILADAGGGASASGSGFFNIPKLTTGPHEITVTYIGYKSVRDTVWIPPGQTTSRAFSLAPEPVMVEPMIVSGIQKSLPAFEDFTESVSPDQLTATSPYGGNDAVKSLDVVSGINFSHPLADFYIQGGNAGEHQLRLDGVPIYNPVSMGRLLGAFSPYAIDKITIKKAGFGSAFGSQLSGIIDISQAVNSSGDDNLFVQINPLNINSRFDYSFKPQNGHDMDVMIASRVDLWDLYKHPQIQQTLGNWDQLDPILTNHLFQSDSSDTFFQPRDHTYDIKYYDLHAAIRLKHNEFHTTYMSAYRGKNFLKTNLFSENTVLEVSAFAPGLFYSIDRYDWTNTMAKIEHQWVINSRFDASLSGYITQHSLNHSYSITNNVEQNISDFAFNAEEELRQGAIEKLETGDRNAISESALKLKLAYSASKNYTIQGGMSTTFMDYRFRLSDFYYNNVQSDDESFLVSGFINNRFVLSPQTQLTVGSRLTFVPTRDLVFAEPRASFKYDEPVTSIGYLSFRLAGGIYRQFLNQFDVSNPGPSSLVPTIRFRAPVDYTTTVPKAYHIAGDALWEPSRTWDIQVETYYKWIPSRLLLNYENLSQPPMYGQANTLSDQQQFITTAKGYAYGGGLTVKKRFPSRNLNLKGRYQYHISRQRIAQRFNGTYQPLPSSQPHNLNVSIGWNIIPRLTFLAQWQGTWGRSWGFRKGYYDYLSIRENRSYGQFTFDNPGGDTLPLFSRLNAGVSYNQPLNNSYLRFRLDLFNLLNHKNVLDWWLSPHKAADGTIIYKKKERLHAGFMPSLSISFAY